MFAVSSCLMPLFKKDKIKYLSFHALGSALQWQPPEVLIASTGVELLASLHQGATTNKIFRLPVFCWVSLS